MPIQASGVRKVNENILQNGRAIIITEEDNSKLDWSQIPDGSLKVNPDTGIMSVKLRGETSWVPGGLKNDGTIAIAKDSKVNLEVFTIKSINGDGTFTYANTEGLNRTKPLTANGKLMFELEKGSYINSRNSLEVFINDTTLKTATTGGIMEVDSSRFSMTEDYPLNTKITARYIQRFNIGNPYPRFYMNAVEPAVKEYGDFWLDLDDVFLNTADGPVFKWWNGSSWMSLGKEAYAFLTNKLSQEIADRISDTNTEEASRIASDNSERTARIAADDSEKAARIAADNIESAARIAADNAETAARITADNMEASTRANLIELEEQARIAADDLERAARIASDNILSAAVENAFKNIPTSDVGGNIWLSVENPIDEEPTNPTDTLASNLVIMTGVIANGGTIPLPAGFTQAQCKWTVSLCNGVSEDRGNYSGFSCSTDINRVVSCIIRVWASFTDGGEFQSIPTTANYMIIGVK